MSSLQSPRGSKFFPLRIAPILEVNTGRFFSLGFLDVFKNNSVQCCAFDKVFLVVTDYS